MSAAAPPIRQSHRRAFAQGEPGALGANCRAMLSPSRSGCSKRVALTEFQNRNSISSARRRGDVDAPSLKSGCSQPKLTSTCRRPRRRRDRCAGDRTGKVPMLMQGNQRPAPTNRSNAPCRTGVVGDCRRSAWMRTCRAGSPAWSMWRDRRDRIRCRATGSIALHPRDGAGKRCRSGRSRREQVCNLRIAERARGARCCRVSCELSMFGRLR